MSNPAWDRFLLVGVIQPGEWPPNTENHFDLFFWKILVTLHQFPKFNWSDSGTFVQSYPSTEISIIIELQRFTTQFGASHEHIDVQGMPWKVWELTGQLGWTWVHHF